MLSWFFIDDFMQLYVLYKIYHEQITKILKNQDI